MKDKETPTRESAQVGDHGRMRDGPIRIREWSEIGTARQWADSVNHRRDGGGGQGRGGQGRRLTDTELGKKTKLNEVLKVKKRMLKNLCASLVKSTRPSF